MHDPLGLSIGTTNLVAVRNGTPPVRRRAVLTLFSHRAPEIGAPAENPGLTEPGTVVSGFVERIGDAVALVSGEGSAHEPDLLLVEALDAMVSAAGADPATSEIAIAVPAHWGSTAVRGLQEGLRTHAGFVRTGVAPCLVSDAVAALTAVNSQVGLPSHGVVGLLDFGGGGTTMTLADAGAGFTPVGETVRYQQFSGAQIDQALLAYVLENVGHNGSDPDGTTAVGQLTLLTEECRQAKEFLSTQTITELVAELPGYRTSIQVTRDELESLMHDGIASVITAFEDMLMRNNIGWNDVTALVAVGGGANIPLVEQYLSSHTRTHLVTAPQPEFAMAVGAALFASGESGAEIEAPTAMAAVVGNSSDDGCGTTSILGLPTVDVVEEDAASETVPELAWSQADDTDDELVPYTEVYEEVLTRAVPTAYAPEGAPTGHTPQIEPAEPRPGRRYRLARLVVGLAALVAMISVGGVVYSLTSTTERQAPPAPSSSVAPPPPSSQPPAPSPVPSPLPSIEPTPSVVPTPSIAPTPSEVSPPPPPPVTSTTTYQPPPTTTTTTAPPMTTTTMTTTTTTTTTEPPATTTVPTTTTTKVPMTTEWLTLPLVPVPIPVPVPQNRP
ncbi:Hsp70 family protein [Mycobacterium botniense]|uniref:Molecular chaperone n=1 Tax=Mycobacterium botniense TaxID=84962 RepID=A0A7I9XUH5_9MYCO|nr:Hsp70 family protein [Mycobacterium botniense]GFG73599.1 hypothetical protein MBOT_09640 [Mycobacterium botniense]